MSEGKRTPDRLPHGLADHALGAALGHVHAPGEIYDHDHDADDNLLAAGSKDLARVELTSIGVDIGSSSVQVAFSRISMYGPGEPLAMRRKVRTRETIYLSPVFMTPFAGAHAIDMDRLRGTLSRAFEAARLTPDDIDTGVVILTGAAAQRANARAISEALAFESGDIVTAAAGDRLEATLAAFGSGAVERSRRRRQPMLNIDIGGATTKLALLDRGHVLASAAMRAGGRVAVFNERGQIDRLDDTARAYAQRCGLQWTIGAAISPLEMARVADAMADDILAAIGVGPLPAQVRAQFLTEPLPAIARDGVMFSGGVAEYVYGREKRAFGDLGRLLGRAIARRFETGDAPTSLLPCGEMIRATVLGCSAYATQMSGATSCVTAPAKLLPRRNLPVLQPRFDLSGEIDAPALAAAIRAHRRTFGDEDAMAETALAFRWRGEPEYGRVLALARGIAAGLADRIAAGANIYLLLEGDVALTLGALLREEIGLRNELLVIDGIALRDFDYVDIGRIRLPSATIPVTVKSLQFGADAPAMGRAPG